MNYQCILHKMHHTDTVLKDTIITEMDCQIKKLVNISCPKYNKNGILFLSTFECYPFMLSVCWRLFLKFHSIEYILAC